jgi:hypothetical protein
VPLAAEAASGGQEGKARGEEVRKEDTREERRRRNGERARRGTESIWKGIGEK